MNGRLPLKCWWTMVAKYDMMRRKVAIKPAAIRSPSAPTFNSRPKEWSSVEAGFCSMVFWVGSHSIEPRLARVVKRLVWRQRSRVPNPLAINYL
jgi:hypothetical protein